MDYDCGLRIDAQVESQEPKYKRKTGTLVGSGRDTGGKGVLQVAKNLNKQ